MRESRFTHGYLTEHSGGVHPPDVIIAYDYLSVKAGAKLDIAPEWVRRRQKAD